MTAKNACAKIFFYLSSITTFFSFHPSLFANRPVTGINKYRVETKNFTYPIGVGSGLDYIGKNEQGEHVFYGLTDRGINCHYPHSESADVIFFEKDFAPQYVKIVLNGKDTASIIETTAVKFKYKNITGFPSPSFGTREKPMDAYFHKIEEAFGLDTESIAIDRRHNQIVIADEYFPSVNVIEPRSGEIIKRFIPGDGLPHIMSKKQPNRGFEAVAVTPNGTIYAALESVLKIDGKITQMPFIRIVQIDRSVNRVKTFAYPLEKDKFKSIANVRIGDLAAMDDENFLIVEQGKGVDGHFKNFIYKINIKGATDITASTLPNGKALEQAESMQELSSIKMITKELLIDMRQWGWTEDKLEGLAVVDERTVAVIHDSDFGLQDYRVISCEEETGKANCRKVLPVMKEDPSTYLWLVKFADPI